ncbi:unnamed protein product [Dibothriocephalus latus]|uniref:Uncharacterized protein n=1 Tax=Dibothriocephalus latus TaxID=60516 RepID=A0A3P7NQS6_DIBLA|nr:unnamed protein product [Dibothriocephalus latus]
MDPTTCSASCGGQRRNIGRRNPSHHQQPQQHNSPSSCSPGVPFFALNIITRLIHLELHFPDRESPDGETLKSLSRLHPFALPDISSTEDFEHRMFKLSKSYEPGELGVPPAAVVSLSFSDLKL